MRTLSCTVAMALMLVPALAMAKKPVQDSGSGCLQNLSVTGGFTTGKQFLAATEHEGVSYAEAFRKTVAAIEAEGMVSVSPNERTGYIAAENPVPAVPPCRCAPPCAARTTAASAWKCVSASRAGR